MKNNRATTTLGGGLCLSELYAPNAGRGWGGTAELSVEAHAPH